MNENFPSDVKLDENPDGSVSFATDVVATIAGLAATEVEGVASMTSPSSGLADMFSRKSTRNFTKGVRIALEGNQVMVDVTIIVEYGSPVPEVARGLQENIKKAIETMTGLEVKSVDVHVTGISFEREQRAAKELDEQQKKMLEESEKAQKAAEEAAAADEDEAAAEEPEAEEEVFEEEVEEAVDEVPEESEEDEDPEEPETAEEFTEEEAEEEDAVEEEAEETEDEDKE